VIIPATRNLCVSSRSRDLKSQVELKVCESCVPFKDIFFASEFSYFAIWNSAYFTLSLCVCVCVCVCVLHAHIFHPITLMWVEQTKLRFFSNGDCFSYFHFYNENSFL